SPSSGYINPLGEEASGGANVWFSGTGQRGFAIHNLRAKAFDSLCLYFAYRKENTSSNADFTLAWSIDDTHWDTLISPSLPDAAAPTGWYWIGPILLPDSAEANGLALSWTKNSGSMRLDDIFLSGLAKEPVI